jgi:phage terminase small subunit
MAPKPLSPRQLEFVRLYLGGATAKQAYIDAWYKARGNAAEVNAARLLRNAQVARLVEEARTKALDRAFTAADLTADRLTREIARLAFLDPRKLRHPDGRWKDLAELDDDTAACVAAVEFEAAPLENPDGSKTLVPVLKRIKLWDKNAALRTGVAVRGMVTEKHDITGRAGGPVAVDLRGLTDADLDTLGEILGRAAANTPAPSGLVANGGESGGGPSPPG